MHTNPDFASCNAPVVLPRTGDDYQVASSNIPPYRGPYRPLCRPEHAYPVGASAPGGDEDDDEGEGEAMDEAMDEMQSSSQRHASLVPLTAEEYDDAVYAPDGKRKKRKVQKGRRGAKRKRKVAEDWELPIGDSQTPVEVAKAQLEAQESKEESVAEEEAADVVAEEAEEEDGAVMGGMSEDEAWPPKQQRRGAAQSSRPPTGKRQTAAVNYKESAESVSESDSD